MTRWFSVVAAVALLASLSLTARATDERLVVHEWGTFTSLQDEQGKSIGWINSDDEPLPPFVHALPSLRQVGDAKSQIYSRLVKDFPQAHPEVTMRLETPVLYFHLPHGRDTWPSPVTASAEFHGGWLTQFYPLARADGPPAKTPPRISNDTVGRLTWNDLRLGGSHPGPATDSKVWLAPRNVDAADVLAPGGQSERYLFYRGVGHVDAPLFLVRRDDGKLDVHARGSGDDLGPVPITAAWFCQFRPDGTCAFTRVERLSLMPANGPTNPSDPVLATLPAEFADGEFAREHLADLRRQMREELVKQGLFADEAEALLNTWELSYFKSWGTRLFFLVPREWTDAVLPLTISEPAEVTRVMVGRIDIVTPEHRTLLKQIANARDVTAQHKELWDVYDRLGRFRNALILDERSRRPTASLRTFVTNNCLEPAAK